MITTVLNTKIREAENKIPSLSGLVKKKTHCNSKISGTEGKYLTTSEYDKFTGEIVDVKIK